VILLLLLGFQVENIRAVHRPEERAAIIAKFNDPNSDVDILITEIRFASVGIDLQPCCRNGMLLAWPWNANTAIQILGRLVRIGQPRFVRWLIFTITGTIYEKHETIIWRKYARQLAAERAIEGLSGEHGIVAMYELIRQLFNQPFNRYLWEVVETSIGSFNDEKMHALSDAVSLIARYAIQHPTEIEDQNKRTPLDIFTCAAKLVKELRANPEFQITAAFINKDADCSIRQPDLDIVGRECYDQLKAAFEARASKLEKVKEHQRKAEERQEKQRLGNERAKAKRAAKGELAQARQAERDERAQAKRVEKEGRAQERAELGREKATKANQGTLRVCSQIPCNR
jgi:hypothetical protein